jgi:hypothetical protein
MAILATPNFWALTDNQPIRKNQFAFFWGHFETTQIKTISLPKYTVSNKKIKLMEPTFKQYGNVVWEPVTVTMIDAAPARPSVSMTQLGTGQEAVSAFTQALEAPDNYSSINFMDSLATSGYFLPPDYKGHALGFSKYKASQLGPNTIDYASIYVTGGEENGKERTIEWRLHEPVITRVDFGELSMGDDNFLELTLEINYDWATSREKMLTQGSEGLGQTDVASLL